VTTLLSTDGGAVFGPEGEVSPYRYRLWRNLSPPLARRATPRRVGFIMLNPSTATHQALDPTVRRCIGYAEEWGYEELEVGNLFAFRATDPRELRTAADPVGPDNDAHLVGLADRCLLVVCAWGARGGLNGRAEAVCRLLAGRPLHLLRLTGGGHPGHPLYLSRSLKPRLWRVS
jgi:hypothetical protein